MAISEFQKLKTRLNAKPFLCKGVLFAWELNLFSYQLQYLFVLSFTLKQTLGNSQILLQVDLS